MAVKTTTTATGTTIKAEMVRKVQDKVSYADGYNIVTGREIVEYSNVTLTLANGKSVSGKLERLVPGYPGHAKVMAQGAVAQVGSGYIRQDTYDIIVALLAELDAENPKSEEQLEIERKQAEAHARWEADLPAIMAAEEFERKMNRADSDY